MDISLWCRCFRSISGFDSVSGDHFSPKSAQRFIILFRLYIWPYETCMLGSLGSSVVIHWIGHISMMQMFSFNFGFWFGFRSSLPSRISPEIHWFYSDWTLWPYETCMLGSLEVVLKFTKLDISLWCRCFLSISGFDSVSGAHYPPESVQRIIYFIQIGHFDLVRRVCWDHWAVVL